MLRGTTQTPRPAAAHKASRARVVLVKVAAAAETAEAPAAADPAEGAAPIYIGFAKGDYAPRAGRKGRVILDDPAKYPSKENLGFFAGAVGGWAGGEAGLWKLREQVAAEGRGAALAEKRARWAKADGGAEDAAPAAAAPAEGAPDRAAPIYLGYGKGDLGLRKSGAPGRVILDDPAKYPSKEDLGFLAGATGGFAAGEKGLQQFVRDGELRLRQPGQPGGSEASPVALAILLAAAGTGGALALDAAAGLAHSGLVSGLNNAPVDETTRSLLVAAAYVLATAGLVAGGRALTLTLSERLAAGAQRLVATGGVAVGAFVAARAVLEI